MTTSRLLSTFRQANVTILTLDPSAAYMTATSLEDNARPAAGVTAFPAIRGRTAHHFLGPHR